MPHHNDLIALARQMVGRDSTEAEWRRAVSTAYYALFHLLIDAATDRLVARDSIRARVARTFEHKIMRAVCQEYSEVVKIAVGEYQMKKKPNTSMPFGLFKIAETFTALYDFRTDADYDLGTTLTQTDATAQVSEAEEAFRQWPLVESNPATDAFLAELWCRGIPKR